LRGNNVKRLSQTFSTFVYDKPFKETKREGERKPMDVDWKVDEYLGNIFVGINEFFS